jgi:hypothetical protein
MDSPSNGWDEEAGLLSTEDTAATERRNDVLSDSDIQESACPWTDGDLNDGAMETQIAPAAKPRVTAQKSPLDRPTYRIPKSANACD